MRTFKVERIRDLAVLPRTFEAPEADVVAQLRRAPGTSSPTSPPTEVVLRFAPSVAGRVMEATVAPEPARHDAAGRLARVAGDRRRHDRDPAVDPPVGQRRRGPGACRPARGRRRDASRAPSPRYGRRIGNVPVVRRAQRPPVGLGGQRRRGRTGGLSSWQPIAALPRGAAVPRAPRPPRSRPCSPSSPSSAPPPRPRPRHRRRTSAGCSWAGSTRIARRVGLVPFRGWGALDALALDRAGRIAASHTLSHTAAGGNVGEALDARCDPVVVVRRGARHDRRHAERGGRPPDLRRCGWTATRTAPSCAATSTTTSGSAWPPAADGSTWVSLVATESPDHTPPAGVHGLAAALRDGRSPHLARRRPAAPDPHAPGSGRSTSRSGAATGAGGTIRNDTHRDLVRRCATGPGALVLFRVQAADRRGTLSAWTTPPDLGA